MSSFLKIAGKTVATGVAADIIVGAFVGLVIFLVVISALSLIGLYY